MSVALLDIINNIPPFGFGVIALSVLVVIFIGIIYWQNTRDRGSKLFFFFSLVILAWGVAAVLFDASIETPFIHTIVVIEYFIAGFIAPALFCALDAFANNDTQRSLKRYAMVYGSYLAISIGFLTHGLLVGYRDGVGGAVGALTFGWMFVPYVIYSVALVGAGLWFLVKKYRDSAGIFRQQIRDFLLVFIITATTALAGTLFSPVVTKTQEFFWVGYIGGAMMFLVATAAILIKYNFLNIRVIVAELFVATIILVLIAELFITTSFGSLISKTGITILILFAGTFFVGSVEHEIQSKEKIARLLSDLAIVSKRLKVLDRKKSEFLSIASHHLRDPLTTVKGYASMLEEGSFGQLSTPVREAVGKIFDSSGRLITMISDFMDISRIESGDMNYVFADVDLRKMVLELAVEMKQYADRASLVITTTIDEGLEGGMEFMTAGDAGKLRQVFSNLIDNSIKYTPRGEVSILLSKSPDGKKVLFSVSDTGIGMTNLTKEKIFKKFSRAEGVNKVYTEGTGLGLYVAKEIVNKHEGRIWAESKGEGMGSSFYVELEAKG